jgi:hypothetical protein
MGSAGFVTRLALLPVAALGFLLAGCPGKPPAPVLPPVAFSDQTAAAGIRFRHHTGATGRKWMPETVGSGCAFLDYDGDGLLDVLYVDGADWPGAGAARPSLALYRNTGDGAFRDATRAAGLTVPGYGMGVAVGDYDNDGDADLFVTYLGPNRLFRNDGGRFVDATATAGVAGDPVEPGGLRWKWSAPAAWVDYDRDGLLDLYVGNYVKWTPATDIWCGEQGRKSYCPPTSYEGVPSLLYRNLGNGKFRNVSEPSGIGRHAGKSFGVAVADYNQDGWPDLAVTNDTKENYLFLNDQRGGFEERGVEMGIALSNAGLARAGMGVDCADWDGSGSFGILIGNFSREGLALYRNHGGASLEEVAYPAGLGEPSLTSLTFGCFFFDYDLDGRPDVFAANGHIDDFIRNKDAAITYEQLPLLFRNRGDGTFGDARPEAGPVFARKRVLRGAAHGDYDNDGDPDIAVLWNGRAGELWRNDAVGRNWVGLVLRGTRSNRDGIGAVVRVRAGGRTVSDLRRSGGSFLSESDPRLQIGLGSATEAEEVRVEWPSGAVTRHRNLKSGAYYTVTEDGAATPVTPGGRR